MLAAVFFSNNLKYNLEIINNGSINFKLPGITTKMLHSFSKIILRQTIAK
jgi:hypothetical protein